MKTYAYHVNHKAGFAEGYMEAEDKTAARKILAKQYEGQLVDNDGNDFNNEMESIKLTEVE